MRLMKPEDVYTPYEKAAYPQKESYLWEKMDIHSVVESICGLDRGDLEESIASEIYDHLDDNEIRKYVDEWFDEQDPNEYNTWWHERNDWLEDK